MRRDFQLSFDQSILNLDPEGEAQRICEFIRTQVFLRYKRKGVVVGLSGGVDSALLACLCVRALGADKVHGVLLPEKESSPESTDYGRKQAEALGISTEMIDISPMISAFAAYENRNQVISELCPEFDPAADTMKIFLPPDLLDRGSLNVFRLKVQKTDGREFSYRLKSEHLHKIVAAQNIKQRTRMVLLYFTAEKLHYVVGGTTNRSEMEQGFFVKYGDGGVDIEPLAHLYKTQVFQVSSHVGVIPEILERAPSPDTWPGVVTDEEFFFRMPFDILDLLLYAWTEGLSTETVGNALDLSTEQVDRAFRDFQSKWNTSWHMRVQPPHIAEDNPDKQNSEIAGTPE